ncbi:MAG: translation initiation factor IF-3 [Planctomycetota bacterium]|nr:translation initiation factor IF-3 [Planctomycetota bacterium]
MRDTGPVKRTRVNDMIRISPIRLIDHNNEQVGVVELHEAKKMADEAGLDLVEISPDVRPPVCKIMDYGKFKYEQSKKEHKSRSSSKQAEMKEVRLGRSIKIDPHDVQIRVDQARKFLMEGHKVQIVQQFRGREMMHQDLGRELVRNVIENLSDIAKVETPPRQAGRRMSFILAPDRPKIEALKRKMDREKAAAAGKPDSQPSADKPEDDSKDDRSRPSSEQQTRKSVLPEVETPAEIER